MKKVERSEILPLGDYEQIRERFRGRIIEEKKRRRMKLSEDLSLLFENHDTVLLQIQEMLRTERITQEKALLHELETYNELLPSGPGLAATLYIEIPDRERRDEMLTRLCAIEEHVVLDLGAAQVRATFEEGRRDKGRAAAVQYLHFPMDPAAVKALLETKEAALVLDHPALAARVALSPTTLSSLRDDL